jgi:NitT/TauT family transport system substrate-binding protein
MRTHHLITLFASFVLLAVTAISVHAEPLTKVTVSYSFTSDFLPVFVAKDTGIFERHGLDVTLANLATTSLAPPALQAGSLHIASLSPALLLLANDGGLDLVAVANVGWLDKRSPHSSLLTRTGFTATTAQDFIGKRIGRPGINSAIDVLIKKWFLDHGVKLDQVTIVETPFNQMADLLRAGQVDAVVALEPVMSRIIASGAGVKSIDFISEVNPHLTAAIFGSTRDWATANRAQVKAFRDSMTEAMAFMESNPKETDEIEQKHLGFVLKPADLGLDLVPTDFDFWIDALRQLKLLQQPADATKLIFH